MRREIPHYMTAVEAALARRRRWTRPLAIALVLVLAVGIAIIVSGIVVLRTAISQSTVRFDDPVEHFKYGSIGAETASGIPYRMWMTLPSMFPEAFKGRKDYSAFGFLYEEKDGKQRDLPIGISKRTSRGVELVWFNCAVCHTGTYRTVADGEPTIVAGMPANNLQLMEFIHFVLSLAGEETLAPDAMLKAMENNGYVFGLIERPVWKHIVLPMVREGLVMRRARLEPLLAVQPDWGPGRVDTFNPYKTIQLGLVWDKLAPEERLGASDFPSIFHQGPREEMQLHWDGNNKSLDERNLSAAIGAGVNPETVDIAAIKRIAEWLKPLPAPPSPIEADTTLMERGNVIYMRACAACHGYRDRTGYKFEGEYLGKVDPIGNVGTDRRRLDSYTETFRDMQLRDLFKGTPQQFRHFTKTNGYANMPLDSLWLRAPYLHNGSVPTLAALLMRPSNRPSAFVRGLDVIDRDNGGFLAPACEPDEVMPAGFCFNTTRDGNGNHGHAYGTELPPHDKLDLLAYLKTL